MLMRSIMVVLVALSMGVLVVSCSKKQEATKTEQVVTVADSVQNILTKVDSAKVDSARTAAPVK